MTCSDILNQERQPVPDLNQTTSSQADLTRKYARSGHPSIEELMAAQGVTFPRDPRDFLGDFWPEEESIDDFLAALQDCRGH
jgi:hypothetical protein